MSDDWSSAYIASSVIIWSSCGSAWSASVSISTVGFGLGWKTYCSELLVAPSQLGLATRVRLEAKFPVLDPPLRSSLAEIYFLCLVSACESIEENSAPRAMFLSSAFRSRKTEHQPW